ncbi:MAG: YceI family protein [Anaerolineales bacterium]|nr:YceI family protein [Anaerolineales bacterium]
MGEEGVDYALQISGDLTVKEVTQPVTFEATVRLEGDTLSGSATATILMSQFGVGPIDIAGILKTEDEVKLTLMLVARPQP